MKPFLQLSWLLMVGSACCNCVGSILLKRSRLVTANASFWATLLSPWFIAALVVYSTGLLLFAKAINRLPISKAIPFSTGLGFILITISSHYLFDERLTVNQLIAVGLIFAGVVAITR
jgi:multidrug transporter EmrE-like cation transporter